MSPRDRGWERVKTPAVDGATRTDVGDKSDADCAHVSPPVATGRAAAVAAAASPHVSRLAPGVEPPPSDEWRQGRGRGRLARMAGYWSGGGAAGDGAGSSAATRSLNTWEKNSKLRTDKFDT